MMEFPYHNLVQKISTVQTDHLYHLREKSSCPGHYITRVSKAKEGQVIEKESSQEFQENIKKNKFILW